MKNQTQDIDIKEPIVQPMPKRKGSGDIEASTVAHWRATIRERELDIENLNIPLRRANDRLNGARKGLAILGSDSGAEARMYREHFAAIIRECEREVPELESSIAGHLRYIEQLRGQCNAAEGSEEVGIRRKKLANILSEIGPSNEII